MAAQGPDVEAVLRNAFQCPYGEALSPAQSSCRPEFLQHIRLFPNDTNFVIEPKAGAGFGTVLCMENSCFTEIPLEPSPFKPDDGGAERGVGWLQKYGEHIQRSPEHVAARNARIQTDKAIKAEAPPDSWTPQVKKSSSPNTSALSSDAEPFNSTSQAGRDRKPASQPFASGSGSSSNAASTSFGFGKAPKKRPSDPKPSSSAGPVFSDDDLEPLDKKPKLDAEPGILSQARQNTLDRPDVTAAPSAVAVAQRKFDALRAREQAAHTAYTAKSLEPMAQRLPTWQAEFADIAAKYTAIATETRSARLALEREKQNAQRVALANGNAPATSGYGIPPGDVTMVAMNALSGQMPGGYPLHNDDSDDEEAALWRAVDGGRDLNQEELDEFVKGVCDSEGFEGNANVNNAATVIGLKDQKDYLPHMRIRLMPHQIIACAWMKNQEAGKQYGGILADEMGLGKTIEAIVTCILNPSKDPKEKTTLVLAPLALLQQWKDELEEKVEKDHVSVLIYHGPDRKSYKERHLRKYDFVLTTYSTLVHDYGDEESLEKKAKQKAKRQQKNTGEPQDWEDFLESGEDGPLFKMCWYRVIIDEAQSIRNRNTKISRAVTRLDSLYRWALTGTPVTNSLADLYPIFRFLQLKPWYDWTRYRDHVVKWEKNRADIAGSKAQVILRTCMLRRKKDSKLDGKELITLPKKTITMNELEFSPEEREIYEMVETRAQQKFNKFLKAGTVMRNYSHVLVLLLRLRQLCVHPALIVDAEQTIAKKEEMKQQIKEDATRARREVGADFVALLRKKRLEAAVERVRAEQDGTEIAEDECAICVEAYAQNENGAVVTRCGHIFCSGCVEDYLKGAAPQDHDDEGAEEKCKANQRPCPMCRKPFAREEVYMLAAFEPTDQQVCDAANLDAADGDVDDDEDETLGGFIVDDDEDEDADRDYGKPRSKKAAKMPNRAIIQDSEEEASEAEDDSVPRRKSEKARDKSKSTMQDKGKGKESATTWSWGEQEPSTKILWAYNELERMFTEDPTDKVIIISSFTSALDLMDEFLQRKNIRTCRYQGDMGISEREQTLRILKKSKKCRVMLLSLKCGGVGLTLTRANRVIALDLAWSTAVESQAFDRVHRIGQEKEVVVNRLTIKNTVEQRILDLQSRKQGLADAATGEGTGKKMGKLTVDDLAGLFGLNRRGERIRPRVARAASDE